MKGNLSGIKRALRSRLLNKSKSKATSQNSKERELAVFDQEYDPKMGYFYTCPCCYRRYVTSEDVEEHLNTCSMKLMPEEKCSTPTISSVSSLVSKTSSLSQASSENGSGPSSSVLIQMLNDIKVLRSSDPEGSGLIDGQADFEDPGLMNGQADFEDPGLINGQDSGLIEAEEIVQGNPTDEQIVADTEDLMPFAFHQYFNNNNPEEEGHQVLQQQIQSHTISLIPEARINPTNSLYSSSQTTLYQLNGHGNDDNQDMDMDDYRDPAIESSYGGFNCPTCDGYFETIQGLQSHVTICISSPTIIPNQQQSTLLPNQPQLTSQITHKSLPPPTPVMTFHVTNGWTQMYPCIPCKKAFKSLQDFNAHNESTHKNPTHNCGVCHKVFKTSRALRYHAVIHTDEKPHQCPICSLAFKHRSTLKSHKLTHKEMPPVSCTFPGCTATFRTLGSFKVHRKLCPHREGILKGQSEGSSKGQSDGSSKDQPEGASKGPQLGQVYKPAAKKKPAKRARRRRSESPDPPSPVEVITIE